MNNGRSWLAAGLLASAALATAALAQGTAPATPAAARPAAVAGAPDQQGPRFPNVLLTNQDGVQRRFYDDMVKGKLVLINFIYTSCTAMCPMETARVLQVQRLLGERVGKDVFLYSISIDPARDTPAVLKTYAQQFGAGPGWEFLTGSAEDVNLLMNRLGLYTADLKQVTATQRGDHPTSLIMGNDHTNRWVKRSVMDDAEVLAEVLGQTLNNFQVKRKELPSYEVARQINPGAPGEFTFRARCSTCHTIGGGEAVGPDLAGVFQRRPRDWVARYVSDPEKVRQEQDSIALSLRQRYGDAYMPSFQLDHKEVTDVLAFIEQAASHGQKVAQPSVQGGSAHGER